MCLDCYYKLTLWDIFYKFCITENMSVILLPCTQFWNIYIYVLHWIQYANQPSLCLDDARLMFARTYVCISCFKRTELSNWNAPL